MHYISCNVLFILFFCFLQPAQAGIILDSTRLIYPAAKQEVTLGITNNSRSPRLMQAWVDNGDPQSHPNTANAPFVVTPPISRLDAGRGQKLRIVFTGGNVPTDRESVYWLNVLEVAPKPAVKEGSAIEYIQFSVRSRIKIFYRPEGLFGVPDVAISALRWRKVAQGIECENPSAFNVSVNDIWFEEGKENTKTKNNGMCPAKSKKVFIVNGVAKQNNTELFFSTINDYGGFNNNKARYTH